MSGCSPYHKHQQGKKVPTLYLNKEKGFPPMNMQKQSHTHARKPPSHPHTPLKVAQIEHIILETSESVIRLKPSSNHILNLSFFLSRCSLPLWWDCTDLKTQPSLSELFHHMATALHSPREPQPMSSGSWSWEMEHCEGDLVEAACAVSLGFYVMMITTAVIHLNELYYLGWFMSL